MKELIKEAIKERIPEVYNFNMHYMVSQEEYLKEIYMTILIAVSYGNEVSSGKILFLKSLCKSLGLNFEKIFIASRDVKKEDFIEFSRKFSKNDMGEHFCIDLSIVMGLDGKISQDDGAMISKVSELIFLEKEELFSLVKIAKGILEGNIEFITSKKFNFINYFFPKYSDLIIADRKITINSKIEKKQIFYNCEIEVEKGIFENKELHFIDCEIVVIEKNIFKKSKIVIIGCNLKIKIEAKFGSYAYLGILEKTKEVQNSIIEIEEGELFIIDSEVRGDTNIQKQPEFLIKAKNCINIHIVENNINGYKIISAENIDGINFIKNNIDIFYGEGKVNFYFKDIGELKFEENRIHTTNKSSLGEIYCFKIRKVEFSNNIFGNLTSKTDFKITIKNSGYKYFGNNGFGVTKNISDECIELK